MGMMRPSLVKGPVRIMKMRETSQEDDKRKDIKSSYLIIL